MRLADTIHPDMLYRACHRALACMLIFLASLQKLSSRHFWQCEIVILITEMHPNVASDSKAQSIKDVCVCVSNLPMATEATWLPAEPCKVAGLCVLLLRLPVVLPQTSDSAFGNMESKYPC